jgi:ATP-binding cassette subfamily F protein 2
MLSRMHAHTDQDIELPSQFDIYHLRGEIEATDKTALEAVLDCDTERIRLEAEIDAIIEEEGGDSDRLQGMCVSV